VLGEFLASDIVDRKALAAALIAGNAADIRLHAHRIKGAARSIGAADYAASAALVEEESGGGPALGASAIALEQRAAELTRWAESFS
jgi:HPt (histidine-containing phosphotransfer) domain-containing protein